jgi:hypothetical protein
MIRISGGRFRSRAALAAQRGGHPADRHFTVLRISGNGGLRVSERVISYDGAPSYPVSIMEFSGGLVTHKTQYFAGPFDPPPWRAALAEPMPDRSADAGDHDSPMSAPDALCALAAPMARVIALAALAVR